MFSMAKSGSFYCLDCGTNAHEPIDYLHGMGVDVIVIDHHQAKGDFPEELFW